MLWVIFALTFIHGIIHLMGFVDGIGIKKMPQLSGNTSVVLSPTTKTRLAYIWLLAFTLFMIALVGLVINQDWWRALGVLAVIISQSLIFIWWKDAKAGTIANIIILLAMLFYHSSN
jgi:hypothetical protein